MMDLGKIIALALGRSLRQRVSAGAILQRAAYRQSRLKGDRRGMDRNMAPVAGRHKVEQFAGIFVKQRLIGGAKMGQRKFVERGVERFGLKPSLKLVLIELLVCRARSQPSPLVHLKRVA